jgi:hypothetical protein
MKKITYPSLIILVIVMTDNTNIVHIHGFSDIQNATNKLNIIIKDIKLNTYISTELKENVNNRLTQLTKLDKQCSGYEQRISIYKEHVKQLKCELQKSQNELNYSLSKGDPPISKKSSTYELQRSQNNREVIVWIYSDGRKFKKYPDQDAIEQKFQKFTDDNMHHKYNARINNKIVSINFKRMHIKNRNTLEAVRLQRYVEHSTPITLQL